MIISDGVGSIPTGCNSFFFFVFSDRGGCTKDNVGRGGVGPRMGMEGTGLKKKKKKKKKVGQYENRTRDLSHPKRESYH